MYAEEQATHSVLKVGIQFVQIGGDQAATEYLTKLDNDQQDPNLRLTRVSRHNMFCPKFCAAKQNACRI